MGRTAAVVAVGLALAGCGATRRAAQPVPTPPPAPAGGAATAVSSTNRLLVVTMPRLDLFTRAQLNPVLAAVGMPLAFSRQADFSGITKQVSLQIHAVEHSAELRVDEAGTVAAAATGISIVPTLAVRPAARLVLDHPFLAFIRDRDTGAIAFAARVTDPSRKS